MHETDVSFLPLFYFSHASLIDKRAVVHPPTGGCETIERCISPSAAHAEAPPDLEISGNGELGSGQVDNIAAEVRRNKITALIEY